MPDAKKPASVTRGELYPIVASIYLLIAITLLAVTGEASSILRTIGYFIMFGVAVSLSILFSVLAIRERGREARGSGDQAALSDRVKQLASDPSQKIEAIKVYREETGASLVEAKEAVEAFINSK